MLSVLETLDETPYFHRLRPVHVRGRLHIIMDSHSEDAPLIIVVEDDEPIAEVIEMVLSEEIHCCVTCFTHARDVLRSMEAITPSLFILDYQLPSMSGLQLYDSLQLMKYVKAIPTIMMSANLPWNELAQRHIVGLQKPFELDALIHLVKHILQSSSS